MISPSPWARRRSFSRVTSSFNSRTSLALGSSLITALHLICFARSAYLDPKRKFIFAIPQMLSLLLISHILLFLNQTAWVFTHFMTLNNNTFVYRSIVPYKNEEKAQMNLSDLTKITKEINTKGLKTDLSHYIMFLSLYQKCLSWETSRKFWIKIKPIHI